MTSWLPVHALRHTRRVSTCDHIAHRARSDKPDQISPTDPSMELMIKTARTERILAARRTLPAERYEAGVTLQYIAHQIRRSTGLVAQYVTWVTTRSDEYRWRGHRYAK